MSIEARRRLMLNALYAKAKEAGEKWWDYMMRTLGSSALAISRQKAFAEGYAQGTLEALTWVNEAKDKEMRAETVAIMVASTIGAHDAVKYLMKEMNNGR